MAEAWFFGLALLGLVTFGGTILVFWLIRLNADRREKKELSAADLQLLQESVEALIGRLRAATDEAVAEIEVRQRALRSLLEEADGKLKEAQSASPVPEDVYRLAGEGVGEAEIARRAGLTRGEVELMLELQATRR